MKSHPTLDIPSQVGGMWSADPPDRLDSKFCALLKNGYIDRTGRVVKARGMSMVATAADLRMTATSARATVRSLHTYEGVTGENPSSRLLPVLGASLLRSKQDNLHTAYDLITFPASIAAPSLDRPAAGTFRRRFFYHQNGFDPPFRVECETEDGTAPSTVAQVLGLLPPTHTAFYGGTGADSASQKTRFPALGVTSYCVTFVYDENRGESGPSPVLSLKFTASDGDQGKVVLNNLPLGGTGVIKRRIYRSKIGEGQAALAGAAGVVLDVERGPRTDMFLLAELPDNTTVTYTDEKDDNALDFLSPVPRPCPFPPIAKYQVAHLDRLFWANVREHPWTVGVQFDISRTLDSVPEAITNYRITVSNTGLGTITLEKYIAGWSTDITVASYKTKTLRAVLIEMVGGGTTSLQAAQSMTAGVAIALQGNLDLNRTYTFMEVSQQAIFNDSDVYWLTAIDDGVTQGARWYPNRVIFSDLTYVERVSPFNSFDLTTEGSKRISGMVQSLNAATLIVASETKPYVVSGSFVPDPSTGVPDVRVDPAMATSGQICYRPDAMCATDSGIFYVADDMLRLFRGERSQPAGRPVQNWFSRIEREPVCRDHLCMIFFAGKLWIALPTEEVAV